MLIALVVVMCLQLPPPDMTYAMRDDVGKWHHNDRPEVLRRRVAEANGRLAYRRAFDRTMDQSVATVPKPERSTKRAANVVPYTDRCVRADEIGDDLNSFPPGRTPGQWPPWDPRHDSGDYREDDVIIPAGD